MSTLTKKDIELLKASIGNRAAAGSGIVSKIYGLAEDIHDDNLDIIKKNKLPSRALNISLPILLGSLMGGVGGSVLGNSEKGTAGGIGGGYFGQMLGGALGGGLGAYIYNKKLENKLEKLSYETYKKAYINGFVKRATEYGIDENTAINLIK